MLSTYFIKKKSIAIGVIMLFILSVILLTLSLSGKSYAADTADQPTKKTLNVTGQGTVKASPDIAYVTLGVITENGNAKTAQQNNAKLMNAVISQIKNSGVNSEDIKTVNFNISPKTDYNQKTGESKIVGYTVSNSAQVTIKDLTKVGNIIDIASSNGSNVTNNVSFGFSDYEKYYNEALKDAVTKAKARAGTIADALGIGPINPVTVSESGGYTPSYNYGNYAMKSAGAEAATPIEAGNTEINATVSVTYEY
jgi:uncharacterized protein